MKRIVVACNAGVATSATIACKIKKLLEERGLEANVEATEITGRCCVPDGRWHGERTAKDNRRFAAVRYLPVQM